MTTKCPNKMSLQIVIQNQSKISRISYIFSSPQYTVQVYMKYCLLSFLLRVHYLVKQVSKLRHGDGRCFMAVELIKTKFYCAYKDDKPFGLSIRFPLGGACFGCCRGSLSKNFLNPLGVSFFSKCQSFSMS